MKNLSKMVLAALFTGLMVAGSLITIPFPGVPLVISNAFPWLAGLLLGPLWASVSTGLYLLLGAFGLPVFAKGAAGIGILFGYTGGYLWGYLLAAFLIGVLRDPKGLSVLRNSIAVVIGLLVVYIPGILWLSIVVFHGAAGLQPAHLAQAFFWGTGPAIFPFLFVIGDLIKAAGVVAIAGVLTRLPGVSNLFQRA